MNQIDTLIVNASTLVTVAGPDRPRTGDEMKEIGAIDDGAVAVHNGMVVETGRTAPLQKKYEAVATIDACGSLVMPGFVDSHTHLIFAGTREHEMELRVSGATYLDILKQGGGIHSTVTATRDIAVDDLYAFAEKRMQRCVEHGTTTVEIKSGYGLNQKTEEKILNVAQRLMRKGPCDIVTTFLGAHTVPKETDRASYITWLTGEALLQFKGKAEFWDVFCEEGAFTLAEAEKILKSAKQAGYKIKIHAGQFHDLGSAGMAADIGAISADHLDFVSDEQLGAMKQQGTVAVLLPGVSFYLGAGFYPDVKRLQNSGVPIALATDFNPGSCPCYSMQMIVALACLKMKMSAAEAITAATINAAYAVNRGSILGSLEPGKQADCLILDIDNPSQIPYFFGTNLVKTVIKKGTVVWDKHAG